MNALQVNSETGFLESTGNAGSAFDSSRKVQFINLAEEHFEKTGTMPDLVSLSGVVGVHPRTVDNHLREDEVFAQAWRNIRLKGKWKLESKMFEYGLTKSGYMDRITWLRKEFPEEYNPDIKIISNSDYSIVKSLADAFNSVNKPTVIATDAVITSTPKTIDASQSDKM
jgi:hypothetical protein